MTGESTCSHAAGPVPLSLYWQKHQTDLTPAPEPMFQPVILEQAWRGLGDSLGAPPGCMLSHRESSNN